MSYLRYTVTADNQSPRNPALDPDWSIVAQCALDPMAPLVSGDSLRDVIPL